MNDTNTLSVASWTVVELPTPEEVEDHLRSLAMLSVGQPALNREEAIEVLRQLKQAVEELRRWRA